jgi:pSer/pThr/pTyr-binding forkhead associated (FHA) protein
MRNPKQYKVGRSNECDVILDHITVSREHAEFFIDPEGNAFLTDLNSTYGTFVNDQKISEPVLLNSGDIVAFGDKQFFDWENEFFGTAPKQFAKQGIEKFQWMDFIQRNKDVLLIYIVDVFLLVALSVLVD